MHGSTIVEALLAVQSGGSASILTARHPLQANRRPGEEEEQKRKRTHNLEPSLARMPSLLFLFSLLWQSSTNKRGDRTIPRAPRKGAVTHPFDAKARPKKSVAGMVGEYTLDWT